MAALQKASNILDITGSLRLALHNSSRTKSAHPELIEVPLSGNFYLVPTQEHGNEG